VREHQPAHPRLTVEIALSALPASTPSAVTIGGAGDTLTLYALDLPSSFLIVGPPASGRTTALATMALSASRSGRFGSCYFVGSGRSPVSSLIAWTGTAAGDADLPALCDRLREQLSREAGPGAAVLLVVESMADYSDGLCDTDLQDLVRLAAAHGHCLLAESEASRAMSCSSSSFGGALRAARTGLFLHPDSHEGDSVFKTDVPGVVRAQTPPGRGYIVKGGRATLLQLALPQ